MEKTKATISMRGPPKTTDNPARRSDQTDWLSVANPRLSSEAEFHGFLEESPDAVIIVDKTSRINFASNRIEAMFGYLTDELVGKPLSILIPERYRDLHAGHLDRFMIDPTPRMMGIGLELRALRKDRSEFQVEISLSPHRTPDGLVVVAAVRDVEQRSSLPPYTDVLSFRSEAPTAPTSIQDLLACGEVIR